MNTLDLSFYLDPPERTTTATLTIQPLAPLSMVTAQPGTYFRSELTPSVHMVYGLLENALGWHLPEQTRKEVLKGLAKQAKKQHRKNPDYKDHPWLSGKPARTAKSKYFSLLQYHLEVGSAEVPDDLMGYDDLWSMHLRDRGMNFPGGSRRYDYRLEEFISKLRTSASEFKQLDKAEAKARAAEKYELGDRKEFHRIPLEEVYAGEFRKLNPASLGDGYPMYYVSPKTRGFVVTDQSYRVPVSTTPALARLLAEAISSPAAPTYLGTSEGWVDLNWTVHV